MGSDARELLQSDRLLHAVDAARRPRGARSDDPRALIVQCLICFWTYRALRVVYKMFGGHELKDDLSDDETAS